MDLKFPKESSQSQLYELQVYYEDTDLSGCVYHANYLKFCDRARTTALGAKETRDLLTLKGLHFVVSKVELSFKKPAFLGDILTVESQILNVLGARVTFEQKIFCQGSNLPIFVGLITLACVDPKFKPSPIPDNFFYTSVFYDGKCRP